MFYEPDKDDHGLPYNPYKSIVVPRPIGWISTVSHDGIANLAPFSQFNNLAYDPPYVMFSASSFPETGRRKDSAKNAADTGEFVVNMATYELARSRQHHVAVRAAGGRRGQARRARDDSVAAGQAAAGRRHRRFILNANFTARWRCRHACAIRSIMWSIGRVIGVHIRDDALTPTASSTSSKSARSPGSAISTTPVWKRSSPCGRRPARRGSRRRAGRPADPESGKGQLTLQGGQSARNAPGPRHSAKPRASLPSAHSKFYLIASGLVGEPTAPVMGMAGATNMNS